MNGSNYLFHDYLFKLAISPQYTKVIYIMQTSFKNECKTMWFYGTLFASNTETVAWTKLSVNYAKNRWWLQWQVTNRLNISNNAVHYSKERQKEHGITKLQPGRGRKQLSTHWDDFCLIHSSLKKWAIAFQSRKV